jgi:hypothetical protein
MASSPAKRRDPDDFAAAYREGLGLAAIAVIAGEAEVAIRLLSEPDNVDAAHVLARWWCRAADAARLAAAANRNMRRAQTAARGPIEQATGSDGNSAELARACGSVLACARRLRIALHTDGEIAAAANEAAARVDAEIARLQRSGGMKSVNRAYRAYRIETTARGEKILRYDEWMRNYRRNLIREVAATLRSL